MQEQFPDDGVIGTRHPLSSSDDEDKKSSVRSVVSITTKDSTSKRGNSGNAAKTKEDLKKEYKHQYREKAAAKAKGMAKAGAKIECRGCRVRRAVDFFFVNDVYDKVCKRSLERIRQRAISEGAEAVAHYNQALKDPDLVYAMLSNYYKAIGGMPLFDAKMVRGTSGKWNITNFMEQYKAATQVLVDDAGMMMWEALWYERSKQTEYGGLGKLEAESRWKDWQRLREAKSPDAPFSDFSGPKGELCFWVRAPKTVTFRNLTSQEKIVQQQTKAPVKNATAEQLEIFRQEAQRGHADILGGIDGSRAEDVQALLSSSSNAARRPGASGFDYDLGLRGSVENLIPAEDDIGIDGERAENRSDEGDCDGDDDDGDAAGSTARSRASAGGKSWKRDENVLRARRKFVQDMLDLKHKLLDAQTVLGDDVKEAGALNDEGRDMLSGERKVLLSKKKGLDLVLDESAAPLETYIRSFQAPAKDAANLEYGAMPCCDSYASLVLWTQLNDLVSEYDKVDTKTGLAVLEKRMKVKKKPFLDVLGACKAAHSEFQSALKTLKKRELQRNQKRSKDDEKNVREAESERKKRARQGDVGKSAVFACALTKESGAKPIKRLATKEELSKVKDWAANRPLIIAKAAVSDFLGPLLESGASQEFTKAQMQSFEQGLRSPSASKYGGRMLTEEQAKTYEGLTGALVSNLGFLGMRFDGFEAHGDVASVLTKTFGTMLWCIAGNNTETVQSEYAFLASLRMHMHGSRDIVVTSAPMVVNWASVKGKGHDDMVSLAQAQNRFKSMGTKDMHDFLSDPSHWVDCAAVDPGDVLYLPVGSLVVSKTRANHAVGLKVGLVVPSDKSAAKNLDRLTEFSMEWYKGAMTDHLQKVFKVGAHVHRSMSGA